jgi:DNA-binding response OmpR family regulator
MTPSIDPVLRARLHRIIDEVLAAAAEPPGADAPVPTREAHALVARLAHLEPEALARRPEPPVRVGRLVVDLAGHEVFSAGQRITLTRREFALLSLLVRRRGCACTREEIVADVWAGRALASARTVDIHVHRLRLRLGEPFTELLETLRNVGYKLRTTPLPRLHSLQRVSCTSSQSV